MSEIRTEGKGNVPEQVLPVMPNRLDRAALTELEKALGGASRVAWLVDETLRPEPAIMQYLAESRAAGILCCVERQGRDYVVNQVKQMLASGRHVVLLPGKPAQVPAALSDVNAHLLTLPDGSGLPALPVHFACYGKAETGLTLAASPYERGELRFMPIVRAGGSVGVTVQAAWQEAAADAIAHHPLTDRASLAHALLQTLLSHPHARLIDGVDDSSMSYRELLACAIMFSQEVKRHTAHKRMGVILPPGKLAVIANLACWLCGVVPVNIDYTATEADFRRVTEKTGLTRFITEARFVSLRNTFKFPPPRDLIYIENVLREMGSARMKFNRLALGFFSAARITEYLKLPAPAPEEEATLLFTGGACGTPKVVSLTHRMLLSETLQCATRWQPKPGESVFSVLPYANSYGLVAGLLLPLLCGCDIVTYPSTDTPKRHCTLLQHYGVKLAALPPEMLRALFHVAKPETFASLRLCLSVGDHLTADLQYRARNDFNLPLWECYGLAETCSFVTCSQPSVTAAPGQVSLPASKPGTVGVPLPGIAVRITDPNRSDLVHTPDKAGLLWLKGASVLSQYLGDEQATTRNIHGGWFCTGDIAMMDADGLLTLCGRKTRFSKIGGEMVPHEKLEQVLLKVLKANPAATQRQLAVVAVPDRTQGERLILLSTLHQRIYPNDLLSIRYGIMNEGYPSLWSPEQILPVKSIPVLPDGRLNYPLCFAGVCKALGISDVAEHL